MAIEKTISPEDFGNLGAEGQRHYLIDLAIRHLPAGDEVDESRRCLNQLLDMASDDVVEALERGGPKVTFLDPTLLTRFARLSPRPQGVVEHAMRKALDEMEALQAAMAWVLDDAAVMDKVRPRPSHLRLVPPAPQRRVRSDKEPGRGNLPKATAPTQGAKHE